MSLVTKLTLSWNVQFTQLLDLAPVNVPLLKDYAVSLQNGTGTGQADKVYHDRRAISAPEDLDLSGGLVDVLGVAFNFARIKALGIVADAANAGNVLVGGVANGWASFLSPAATGLLTFRPGAAMAMFAGVADATAYAVTAATADLLHVAPSAGTLNYDIIIVGSSA